MAEAPKPEDFRREYYYQLKVAEQAQAFGELLSRFSPGDDEVTQALRQANAQAVVRDPSFILGPDALRELKEKSPDVYSRIVPVYGDFLKEKAGLG